jgi:hypothetical protein
MFSIRTVGVPDKIQTATLALSKGPNRVGVFRHHLRTETDPVSETLCSVVFRIPDDGQSPKPFTNSNVRTLKNLQLQSPIEQNFLVGLCSEGLKKNNWYVSQQPIDVKYPLKSSG